MHGKRFLIVAVMVVLLAFLAAGTAFADKPVVPPFVNAAAVENSNGNACFGQHNASLAVRKGGIANAAAGYPVIWGGPLTVPELHDVIRTVCDGLYPDS